MASNTTPTSSKWTNLSILLAIKPALADQNRTSCLEQEIYSAAFMYKSVKILLELRDYLYLNVDLRRCYV